MVLMLAESTKEEAPANIDNDNYLDSEKIGNLTAAWVALEEIKADAGRFFLCSGSHKIDLKKLNDLISKGVEKNSIFFLSQ